MKKIKFKTDFKYKLTIVSVSLLLLVSIVSFNYTKDNFFIVSTIIGLLSFIIIVIATIGLVKSIKKLRKPITKKSVFLMIVMGCIIGLFVYLIVANTVQAVEALT